MNLYCRIIVFALVIIGLVNQTALGQVLGGRYFTFATVVRVNQIETSRTGMHGADESGIHSPVEAKLFRETVEKAWPGARITWAFSWQALKDQRPNYLGIKELVVQYHHQYGDEITFLPGGYFANMYNTREQVNKDLHEGLQMVSEMVGDGYRPQAVLAGFLSAENLRYLAEEEDIHVCQGNIWSQYAIDNGDGEGSICYPYYPSLEHFCKPAQGEDDFIDCVNLDGWTIDFLNGIYPGGRRINGEWCGSRQGVGPIETVIRLGTERGTKEMLHVTAAHFDKGFELNKFGWITCTWELGLVEGRKIWGYNGRNGLDGMIIWLSELRRRWPDAQCITHGEFGLLWRDQFKNNDELNYQFVQRGSGVCGSDPDKEIRWFMNKDFRAALHRDWRNNEAEKLIDFTRYDIPAQEPDDPTPGQHSRNWSLMNRLNQKGTRPQDQPMDIQNLLPDEKEVVKKWYPDLIKEDPVIEELSKEFNDPDKLYRPGAFWCWLNGNQTKEAITRDLNEMSEKGMGRAEIWDVAAIYNEDDYIPAGPAFFSDSSLVLIKHALDEGQKRGMKIGMVGSSGWNAGGTWVEPEWASKQLYFSSTKVQGPFKKSIELPFPEVPEQCPKGPNGLPVFHKEVAVMAIPVHNEKKINSIDDIVLISTDHPGGKVEVNLPAGDWEILRFICSNNGQMLIVPSPKSKGLFIDFLDPESTKKHLGYFMKRLGYKPGVTKKGGLAYVEFDSMELAEGIPWTDDMPAIFKKQRGYELTRYLPILTGWDIDEIAEHFLYDWKKTVSDQLIYSHYISGREFLNQYGIELVAEAGGPGPPVWATCPVDALKALGNVNRPRGEFWIQHRDIYLVKEVASAAHIYGRKVVDAESFTTWRRWKDSPFDLKKSVDRAFCEGLNFVTFHTFASTSPEDGLPGRTYHAGSDINHANTWWNKSGPFMDYLSRCSYLLQQGRFVADACYYYGDQAPNFWPAHHEVPEKIIPNDLGPGYDYDVINSDVILHRMSVKEGKIFLPDGLNYRVMVLPDQNHMPLAVLKKLEQLVSAGATIIGQKPYMVPYLNDHDEDTQALIKLANLMWSDEKKINHYGKGRVISGMSIREVLQADGQIPDFSYNKPGHLDYIHRNTDDADIYFIRNKGDNTYMGTGIFRVTDKNPELWDPASGRQLKIENYKTIGASTVLNLDLAPGGSAFVVFHSGKRKLDIANESSHSGHVIATLDKNWLVSFPTGWGAPESTRFKKLKSWTEADDPGIRYFSGTGSYTKSFKMRKADLEGSQIHLDLGQVADVAEVMVNGQSAGILWKPPYTVNVTPWVKAGKNELTIEVVNQWVNRLTGDMLAEPADRFCKTNMPYITSDDFGVDNWAEGGDETYRVKTSGLLGPVVVKKIK